MTNLAPALVVLGLIFGVVSARGWSDVIIGGAGASVLFLVAPVAPRGWWVRMRPFAYFSVVTIVFGGLGEGQTLVSIGSLHWSVESVSSAGVATVRLLLLGALFSWISLRVGVSQIVGGMWTIGRWLKRRGINADPILLAFSVAVRFLPLMQDEAGRLRLAWEARGAALGGRSPVGRARDAAGLIVPLIAAALRKAEDFANAVEVRTRGSGELPSTGGAAAGSVGRDDGRARRLLPDDWRRQALCVLAAWMAVIARVWNGFA